MSLENCKKFIEEISVEHNLILTASWKRIEKFKENNLTIRKFENQQGDEIVISEDNNGKYNLLSIDKSVIVPEQIKQHLNSSHLYTQLYKLYLDLVSTSGSLEDNLNLSELHELSQKSVRKYLLLKNDSYLKKDLENYKPNPKEDLPIGYEILSILSYDSKDNISIPSDNFVHDTSSEKVGVIYSTENMDLYYVEKEGISFFRAMCGGDWEMPIHFLVYWSEADNRLKGFFPKGDANIYNIHYQCAYGSEEEISRQSDFANREAYDQAMNLAEQQMTYIHDNFDIVYDKALNNAFKQLKKIIIEENLSKKMKP